MKGKIITADAMHCQRETCKKITQKGGEYVLTLKKNQPELFEDVKFYFGKIFRLVFFMSFPLEIYETPVDGRGNFFPVEKYFAIIGRKKFQLDWRLYGRLYVAKKDGGATKAQKN